MAVIAPAVLAKDPHEFREQMERVAPFATRVQVDLTDGVFTKTRTLELERAWWLKSVLADLHLMYKHPEHQMGGVIKLQPHMVIIHAEADGNFLEMAEKLHSHGIKVGVALLHDTPVSKIEPSLKVIDHVLIFSGDLGKFGGQADLTLLAKVKLLKKIKPSLEIGWDGGVNDQNAAQLARGGVDVLNVGGFIQKAEQPEVAYAKLKEVIDGSKHETKTKP